MNHLLQKISLKIFIVLSIVLIDQLSKWWVLEGIFKEHFGAPSYNFLEWYQSKLRLPFVSIDILPFFNLTMVWNEGVGLGLLGDLGPYILIGLSLVICAILIFWMIKNPADKALQISGLLILGGALGNIIDRIRFGAVADFFDIHFFGWHYPVFNVADSVIVIGVFWLLLNSFRQGKVQKS